MGKQIVIKRKRKFTGAAIKFFVVWNLDNEEFKQNVGIKERLTLGKMSSFLAESDQVYALPNGRSITINATDEDNSFFVVAFTSEGRLFSERIFVDKLGEESEYLVSLKVGFLRGKLVVEQLR